ncbi:neuromedin-U receptor 2-like [Acanthaster planci]|uniref:Neuromedin-U receptor 2-like n=1 Tax=Acanthaster planci TaxID=133434 RepID=A0A8B7XGR1_ACAPL|nr:neuromedin-U receptor 2-like [Acanthaster planci]XP_022079411.1 neuromedin-U receptor 2-like [Acanthaster planci]
MLEIMENSTNSCDYTLIITALEDVTHTDTSKLLITVFLPCILVMGLTGNLIFLFVLYRVRWMRSDITFYLMNLAIADITFLSFTVGEKLWMYMTSLYMEDVSSIGPVACFLFYPVQAMTYFASIALVTIISYERLQAICEPMGKIMTRRKHHSKRLAACSWFLGGAFSCLLIPGKSVVNTYCFVWDMTNSSNASIEPPYLDPMLLCNPLWSWSGDFANCLQTVPFFMAMVANSIMYFKIIQALKSTSTNANTADLRARTLRDRNKVTRMLVANGIIFFCCLAPFQTASLLRAFFFLDTQHFETASTVLMYLNSAVNPIVYNCTNSRYRMAFRLAFTRGPVSSRTRRFRSVISMEEYHRSSVVL